MLPDVKPLATGSVIGIIGGGQLARMLAMDVARLGYHAHIFSPQQDCPASEVSRDITVGDYRDETALKAFADAVDVVTVEFENIPYESARYLSGFVPFYPAPDLFAVCQHRGKEKAFVQECGGQTARYELAHSLEDLQHAVEHIGVPCIAKHTTEGYDGKGQYRIKDKAQCVDVWQQAEGKELIVEAFVPFVAEASVIVARDASGEIELFPIAENMHVDGILATSNVPASLAGATIIAMESLATNIAMKGELIGLLAIEFFILEDGDVLVNEMAPRPHNSGHWTMDGCSISQFEQLARICAGLPMGTAHMTAPTRMTNLIGDDVNHIEEFMCDPHAVIHLYGKGECRQGRKMGHVNVTK